MDNLHWSINRLISGFMDKDIQLPEIQRKYVWSAEQVRALIDSIYKGYPSGAILLWKTDPLPKTRESSILNGADGSMPEPSHLLLDGRQRLTALAAVLTGMPVRVAGSQTKAQAIEVYFNMDHPERPPVSDTEEGPGQYWNGDEYEKNGAEHLIFQLKNKNVVNSEAWIPVTKLFREGVASIMIGRNIGPDHPNHNMYLKRLNKLYITRETYLYPVQILDKDSLYEEVADIFVRLNTQGAKLRKADLALAQVTARWPGAMDTFSKAVYECEEKGYILDEGFMIKCLVSIATGQSKFRNMGRTSVETLKDNWGDTVKGLRYAIDFLKRNAKIDTTGVLPSVYLLVPIVCLAVKNGCYFPRVLEQKAIKWFYEAMIWGRYSKGSVDTMLDEDLAAIRDGGKDPFDAMIEKIRLQSGRLEIKEEDLVGKTTRNPLFCMMYVLARRGGARDWGTGLPVSAGAGHDIRSQHSRIFARGVLDPLLVEKHGRQKALRLYGDIANAVFTAKRTSRHMEKSPSEYLPEIVGDRGADALASQCVPNDPTLWRVDRYEDFLAARRTAIVQAVNGLIKSLGDEDQVPADDKTAIIDGETSTVEFKSSLLWDHRRGVKNTALVDAVLKTITAFMNSEGGTLYVGVSDDGAILGIGGDYACLGGKGNWDVWSQAFANAFRVIGPEHSANIKLERIRLEGRDVAKITVRRGQKPVYVDPFGKAEFYIRVGTTSQPLNPKQATEYIRERFEP